MSAALAAAIVRNRPAIGSRHTYTVETSSGKKRTRHAHGATVTSYADDRPRITLDDRGGLILTEWPGWWQDGTMRSEP